MTANSLSRQTKRRSAVITCPSGNGCCFSWTVHLKSSTQIKGNWNRLTCRLLQSILMFFWWLTVGTDQSGRGAPLIGSARRLSDNGRKSLLLLTPGTVSPAASILTPLSSLPSAQHHARTLHRVLQDSDLPSLCCCAHDTFPILHR